ncbi:hypothetical protein BV25DRAFT_357160 [Artomyces pyxidatus]|uniref:Uncharacterized protein n=1 Tax=Artomyces pyxidatus TaxID=48021 RepID=A0ACB8T6J5_9AGAM|nr:hypothetical protein BV25DRAFT_357160 [Artomyces pyxidatus]
MSAPSSAQGVNVRTRTYGLSGGVGTRTSDVSLEQSETLSDRRPGHNLPSFHLPNMPIIPTSKPFVPYRKKQTPPAICRALLIGITYGTVRCNGYEPLRGPAIDAHAMEDLLLRKYLFKKADVVVMTDEEVNQGTHLWPTRQNILKEIDRLVYGARAGDNFVFHYAGHAGQTRATVDQREEDGLDEYLIACDYERILNDDLRRLLVDRLPRGTRLTAIFDACHSGTLLDLDHYHCDQHVQRSKSETDLQRKVPMLSDAQNRFSADVNCFRISSAGVKLFKAKLPPVMIVAWMSVSLMRTVKKKAIRSPTHTEAKSDTHLISRCRRRHCEFSLEDGPSVISVSACADHQINWEGGQRGKAMTSLLIEILDRNPSVNVGALGETLRRDLFRAGCSRIRDFLSWKRGHPLTVLQNKTLEEGWRALRDDEMPQFGSLTRLRKDKPFLVPRQLTRESQT